MNPEENVSKAKEYLLAEIDKQTAELWQAIKKLPLTSFKSYDKALDEVILLGDKARKIQKLWAAHHAL